MGLAELQQAMAKLWTDAELRKKFIANPESSAHSLGLSSLESQRLASISAEQIESFAQSLRQKRLSSVRSLLPRTCHALGDSFSELFLIHTERFQPRGCHKHRDDALEFAKFLYRNQRTANISTLAIKTARYESGLLDVYQSGKRIHIRFFFRDVTDAYNRTGEAHRNCLDSFAPHFAIWIRSKLAKRFHFIKIPLLPCRVYWRGGTAGG